MNPAVPASDDDSIPPTHGRHPTPTMRVESYVVSGRDRHAASTSASTSTPGQLGIEMAGRGVALAVPVIEVPAHRVRSLAETLLVANGVDDDRYRTPTGSEAVAGSVGAALTAGELALVTISGTPDRGRLQLDVMARWPYWPGGQFDALPNRLDATEALVAHCLHLSRLAPAADGWLEVWAKPEQPWHHELARRLAVTSHRALHQLRCELPVVPPAPTLATRDLDPAHDLDAMLAVNNRAFALHPDQGDRERSYLETAFAHPDFDPADVRIADDNESNRMIGFCWTKIHPPAPNRAETAGEIYVVGIDPDFQGRGLGVPLTAAGLDHLHRRGATTGMLYVEADNQPALATYRTLGFTVHRTDRAWRHE